MSDITFECKQISKTNPTRVVLTVKDGDKTLHVDQLDVSRAEKRTKFIGDLVKKYSGLKEKGDELSQRLIDMANQLLEKPPAGLEKALDVDSSSIVRPHLLFTKVVCGTSVPQIRLVGNKPSGYWLQYLQWADGRRERRDLERRLALAERDLWLSAMPPEPGITETCQWSQRSRDEWLDGHTPALDKLMMDLLEAINYFLAFPPSEAEGCLTVLALWTLMSYVYPIWPAVPYLSIGGPLGSGKSRVFDILVNLVFRPTVSSNMTAPCLFRTLDSRGGTLLLDEAERLRSQGPEVAEIMSILLAGYKAGQKAQRLEKVGESFNLVNFDVFGPKAIACINELPPALASRCIRLTMFRAPRASCKPGRRIDTYPKWGSIRDELHCTALVFGNELTELARRPIRCEGLHGRDLEIWAPLLQLAQFLEDRGGVQDIVKVVTEYAQRMTDRQKDDSVPCVDEAVLQALVNLLELNMHGVRASEVLTAVQADEPALFGRYSARGIGAILKRYGLQSTRSGGKSYFRPTDEQLLAIQDSYGINLGLQSVESAQSAHCALSQGDES